MRRIILSAAALLAIAQSPAAAADAGQAGQGKAVFERWCAPCHGAGPGHPGTVALAAKYKGAKPGELERRSDLTPDVVAYMVRNGVSIMPIFRKTEVSDADLAAVGAYLSARNGKSAPATGNRTPRPGPALPAGGA